MNHLFPDYDQIIEQKIFATPLEVRAGCVRFALHKIGKEFESGTQWPLTGGMFQFTGLLLRREAAL